MEETRKSSLALLCSEANAAIAYFFLLCFLAFIRSRNGPVTEKEVCTKTQPDAGARLASSERPRVRFGDILENGGYFTNNPEGFKQIAATGCLDIHWLDARHGRR
jgi:hypothetical protein